ncbi:MAG: SHOCT domain-containing protein, partial [Candidatus Diapherotrites archaeon]|nr:SHOCT domain-containing protein [Candidatus Diapherotrites archaeon]
MANDTVEMIKRLKKLFKSGAINKKEYDKFKKQVLEGKDLKDLLHELEEDLEEDTSAGQTRKPSAETPVPQPVAPPATQGNPLAAILIILFIIAAAYVMWETESNKPMCDEKPGRVLCGFCASTLNCRYCDEGYTCNFATSGDTCSALTCTKGDGPTPPPDLNPCNPGYCYSGGHCCPSYARFYCKGQCYDWDGASAAGCTSN